MSDLISRSKLLEELKKSSGYNAETGRDLSLLIRCENIVNEQPSVEAVPKSYADQIRWERDIAIEQLNEIGCQFGQKMDEVKMKLEASQWIPCSERMPEEHDSIFKKAKGTDKWRSGMFESISDNVNVTVEFEDGTKKTQTSHTIEGNWSCEKDYGIKKKVIAWMPLPEPYTRGIE